MKSVIAGREIGLTLETPQRRAPGGFAVRVSDLGPCSTEEHAHDWPILSVFVVGEHIKVDAGGRRRINGPSIVLHPAGVSHANDIGPYGAEQIDIVFDPAWLRIPTDLTSGPLRCWSGRIAAESARLLLEAWRGEAPTDSGRLAALTRFALQRVASAVEEPSPAWLPQLEQAMTTGGDLDEVVRRLGVSKPWAQQAYRRFKGEGIAQAIRRRRVERAMYLLRWTALSAAEVAVETGFADQSHMVRTFVQLLGRTPGEVRHEVPEPARFPAPHSRLRACRPARSTIGEY